MTKPVSVSPAGPTKVEASQAVQRVRVALTGLVAVMIFIGLASAVFRYASTESPVTAVGAAKPEVVANLTDDGAANATSEPLAELGIAPGTVADGNVAAPQ